MQPTATLIQKVMKACKHTATSTLPKNSEWLHTETIEFTKTYNKEKQDFYTNRLHAVWAIQK